MGTGLSIKGPLIARLSVKKHINFSGKLGHQMKKRMIVVSSTFLSLVVLFSACCLKLSTALCVANVTQPVWCADSIDTKVTDMMKKTMKAHLIRVQKYSKNLMFGHELESVSNFQVAGLVDRGECPSINLTAHPNTTFKNNVQFMSNMFWDFQLLNLMYRDIFKLIKVQENSRTSQEEVLKLTTFQVMIDQFLISIEDYLAAAQCSCSGVMCSLHVLTEPARNTITNVVEMGIHTSGCSPLNMLGQVVLLMHSKVYTTLLHPAMRTGLPSTYKVCETFSNDRYPDGC